MKSLRGFFCLFALFFFSFLYLARTTADGKYWATYLTTLFLNFLISNAGLFVCSFEIFASTQNVSVAIHLEIVFLIGLMSLQRWRPPTAESLGINLNMQITRTPQTSQLRISGTNPKLSYVNNSLGNSEALQNAPWRTSVLPPVNLRFSLLVWWLKKSPGISQDLLDWPRCDRCPQRYCILSLTSSLKIPQSFPPPRNPFPRMFVAVVQKAHSMRRTHSPQSGVAWCYQEWGTQPVSSKVSLCADGYWASVRRPWGAEVLFFFVGPLAYLWP